MDILARMAPNDGARPGSVSLDELLELHQREGELFLIRRFYSPDEYEALDHRWASVLGAAEVDGWGSVRAELDDFISWGFAPALYEASFQAFEQQRFEDTYRLAHHAIVCAWSPFEVLAAAVYPLGNQAALRLQSVLNNPNSVQFSEVREEVREPMRIASHYIRWADENRELFENSPEVRDLFAIAGRMLFNIHSQLFGLNGEGRAHPGVAVQGLGMVIDFGTPEQGVEAQEQLKQLVPSWKSDPHQKYLLETWEPAAEVIQGF